MSIDQYYTITPEWNDETKSTEFRLDILKTFNSYHRTPLAAERIGRERVFEMLRRGEIATRYERWQEQQDAIEIEAASFALLSSDDRLERLWMLSVEQREQLAYDVAAWAMQHGRAMTGDQVLHKFNVLMDECGRPQRAA